MQVEYINWNISDPFGSFCKTSRSLSDFFRNFSFRWFYYYSFCLLLLQPSGTNILNEDVDCLPRCYIQVVLTAVGEWGVKWNGIHHCAKMGRILSSLTLYHTVTYTWNKICCSKSGLPAPLASIFDHENWHSSFLCRL